MKCIHVLFYLAAQQIGLDRADEEVLKCFDEHHFRMTIIPSLAFILRTNKDEKKEQLFTRR